MSGHICGPVILLPIAFGYFRSGRAVASFLSRSLLRLVQSCLGSAMLIHHEMDTHPHFTPWLAGSCVAPAYRRRGIGRALAEHVVREAAARGYFTVYLFTPTAQDFFSRFGWSIVEHPRYEDTDVTIMAHTQVA